MEPPKEDDVKITISGLEEQMETLRCQSSKPCIFRVPKRLRKINPEAYTPQVVSIGPFHHGKPELRATEKYKLWYLDHMIKRFNLDLSELMRYVKMKEREVRDCYSETIPRCSNAFTKMVLIDAAFVIGFIARYTKIIDISDDDPIFKLRPYMVPDIEEDLAYILENQLPLFILEELAAKIFGQIVSSAFMSLFVGSKLEELTFLENVSSNKYHFVQILSVSCQVSGKKSSGLASPPCIPSAVKLHQAGIEFRRSDAKLLDIRLSSEGILEMPLLEMEDDTDKIFRNIIAFEQCHGTQQNLTNYIVFLDKLVKTAKDAELLLEKKVIHSGIGGPQVVAETIAELDKGIIYSPESFGYGNLCEDLNKYCEKRRNQWRANLIQNYLNSPCAIVSVIAASAIVVLALLQTVASWLAL